MRECATENHNCDENEKKSDQDGCTELPRYVQCTYCGNDPRLLALLLGLCHRSGSWVAVPLGHGSRCWSVGVWRHVVWSESARGHCAWGRNGIDKIWCCECVEERISYSCFAKDNGYMAIPYMESFQAMF